MKTKSQLLCLLILCVFNQSFSQYDTVPEPAEKGIWLEPIAPEFPGGEYKLKSFIKLIQLYPDSAKANGIEGKVFIQFIVNKNGSLSDLKILRSPDSSLSMEALRIMKLMPNFIPGTSYNNETVRVRMVIPIEFKIAKSVVFDVVKKMPEFRGGNEELYEYLSKNLKFSNFRLEREIKRNLYIKFIVEKDGSISNLTMIKNYNEEIYKQIAIAFNNMAKWDPGVQHQKTVRVKYILPIRIHSR